jgi:hypothetical protein
MVRLGYSFGDLGIPDAVFVTVKDQEIGNPDDFTIFSAQDRVCLEGPLVDNRSFGYYCSLGFSGALIEGDGTKIGKGAERF